MSNSNTLLDTISSTQSQKEVVVNALLDAASPSMLWGRHASACNGLTWGYYGGTYFSGSTANTIANGTVTLTASTTNYVYASATTGAVSVNTTGFPAGSIPLYTIVTGTTTATSYTDQRSYLPAALAGGGGTVTSVGLSAPTQFTVGGSPVTGSGTLSLAWANQNANYVFAGPTSGGAAAPTFRLLAGADIPVFGASGASHSQGGVPDPGSTAGSTRYLREDGTWSVPAGGGGGGTGTVTSVGALGGVETDQGSGAAISGSGNIRTTIKFAGGAIQTAAYTFVSGDRGTCLTMNSSSAVSQALPSPTGATGNFPGGWWGNAENIGAGLMTLTVPSGLTLDGVTNGTLALTQNAGVRFFTDGTNWFTIRSVGANAPADGTADTPPVLANFTWLNQGSTAQASQQNGFIDMSDPTSASGTLRGLIMNAPSTPYKITVRMRGLILANYQSYGLVFYDSTTGKAITFGPIFNILEVFTWSSVTSTGSAQYTSGSGMIPPAWLRVRDDGTNLYADVSTDGVTFINVWSASRTAFLTNPNRVGFYFAPNGQPMQASLHSWLQS